MVFLAVNVPEIYAICVDGVERYIGKTVNRTKRLTQHLSKARNGAKTHLATLLRAALRDGKQITAIWVDEVQVPEEWGAVEAAYIQCYRDEGYDLVNATPGGDGVGAGPDNVWFNKKRGPRSPEHNENWRLANIGKHSGREWTPEEREAARQRGLGVKHSPERIEKMRKGKIGKKQKPRSPEHCAALSVALTGKKASDETRMKQRLAKLGKLRGPHTPEHCAKISAAHQRRRQQ